MFGTEHNLSVNEQLLKNYLYLINNFTTHHQCKYYHSIKILLLLQSGMTISNSKV